MSETDNNTEEQKPETSELAKWSLGLSLVCFVSIISLLVVPNCMSVLALLTSIPLAIILGLASVFAIRKSGGQLKGTSLAVSGIVIHLALGTAMIGVYFTAKRLIPRISCSTNLAQLAKAIHLYTDENDGKYPTAEKWCDLLIEETNVVSQHMLRCKGATDEGPSHYAINPNAEPNSPPDMVLLFEAKGGWNQFGGPEILTAENHKGKGCNILFNNGSVKFIKTDQLGRLKWKVEEPNSIE